ncbi:MAG TPA: pyridoxal-dependent decarboxylase, exosortase A system-associated [Candidatus Omnitrophota bacterium]|nr:pyridoxal-dependent decarboxylase, exosortase A system-associated [Candidatus Omnitrophota bacterium]HPD84793.1 pyridoxal-dependent decarboxylase, exosortase A system-associated [Candidatus Omnitrophota bacterium]HRZ03651.1 pyridoxal-dependent decarboxylase, exosortase A system-associated [Candidatus Omnitrophota bacterium]
MHGKKLKGIAMGLNLRVNNNHVCLNAVDLHAVARKYGTPLFLYDLGCISHTIKTVKQYFTDGTALYYSVKANPNAAILAHMRPLIDGVDVSSGGELALALSVGFRPGQISFAAPGKTDAELSLAITHQIGSISTESLAELKRIEKIAATLRKRANVSVRINPASVPGKFMVKMGGGPSQFGIDEEQCADVFRCLKKMPHCRYTGIHVYSGTQCLDEEALLENVRYVLQVSAQMMKVTSLKPERINFGGGFGVTYHSGQKPLNIERVCSRARRQIEVFKRENGLSRMTAIFELGRYLVAEAGIYIAQVVDIKQSRGRTICTLDGGLNHHLAAAGRFGPLLRQNFKMCNLSNAGSAARKRVTLTGPLCTAFDILGEKVAIANPQIGHYIAILNSGAYAYSASPLFFLSRPTPRELLVNGASVSIARESFTPDLLN